MKKPIIGGNWKMNLTRNDLKNYWYELSLTPVNPDSRAEVILFPQACFIDAMAQIVDTSRVKIGAQICGSASKGAYTGQNSVEALMSCGAEYFLTGHSETRYYLGVTSEEALRQAAHAITCGGKAIHCIPVYLHDIGQGEDRIASIFSAELDLIGQYINPNEIREGKLMLCYSPVWAIGTGKPITVETLARHIEMLYDALAEHFGQEIASKCYLLHDGSVKADTIAEQMSVRNLAGAIAGGVSLKPQEFRAIIDALL